MRLPCGGARAHPCLHPPRPPRRVTMAGGGAQGQQPGLTPRAASRGRVRAQSRAVAVGEGVGGAAGEWRTWAVGSGGARA